MTERSRSLSCENSGYITSKMVNDLSPKKTMLVLVIVVGCFAVLWPKVFYPMIMGTANNRIKPSSIDRTQGCCDVISEKDVTTIKLMSEICSTIIEKDAKGTMSNKELISKCQNAVLETCGIDISSVLKEQVRLGHTTMQILQEIRSLNGSLCLKYNFGVAPWKLGVPHRVTVKVSPSYNIRQERPLHLRSEMVHPAFRERGRAIPQAESFPPTKPNPPSRPIPKIVEGRPGPIPGMRPTLGGAGHVVPAPKHGGGSMGLIMPIYTIGIVVFFTYTVMKIVFKKQPEVLYPPVEPDPQFRREVFEADRGHLGSRLLKDGSGKLVVNAMSALLDEVDMELSSRRKASEVDQQDALANGTVPNQEDDQGSVQVLGMETTASCEGGQKWTRAGSPVLPVSQTPQPLDLQEPPQEIFLEGSLPPQSHLLVTDSATEAQDTEYENDPAVVLAGKMTLSVISLDSTENGTEESSSLSKKHEDRSSSNVSEEFEKIDVAQLEEHLADVPEAQSVLLERFILDENKEDCVNIEYPESRESLSEIPDESLDQENVISSFQGPLNIEHPDSKEDLSLLQSTLPEQEFTVLKNQPLQAEPVETPVEFTVNEEDNLEESLESDFKKESVLDHDNLHEIKQVSFHEQQPLDNSFLMSSSILYPRSGDDIRHESSLEALEIVKDPLSASTIIGKENLEDFLEEPTPSDLVELEKELEVQSKSTAQVLLDNIEEPTKIDLSEGTSLEEKHLQPTLSSNDITTEISQDKNKDENFGEIEPQIIEYISDPDEDADEEVDEEEVEEEVEVEEEEIEEEEEDDEEEEEVEDQQIAHV